MPSPGVYVFSENDRHLYIGRSKVLRGRYGRHCLPGAKHRQAAFAFRLARKATDKLQMTYRPDEGSRKGLMLDEAFVAAKERIRKMEYRYGADQNRQALHEIYSAIVLETPYNDFGTH